METSPPGWCAHDESEPGVQLVEVAIGGDTAIRLRHAGAVEERRVPRIARPGINFHRPNYFTSRWRTTPNARRPKPPGAHAPASPGARSRCRCATQRFRRRLLDWYRRNGRDLPWRRTRDPYHILVSEVMLQQTQVDRVLPKYEEWLGKFPTLEALATANEADVTETWRPLGYNIRPRRLHAIAKESVAKYGGELPGDHETLLSFKGIGAYTAGAVLSFAFGQRAAILDTNVARVLFRVFVGRGQSQSARHAPAVCGRCHGHCCRSATSSTSTRR